MAGAEIAEFSGGQPWWLGKKITAFFSWKRTSLSILASLEHKILSCLKLALECRYVGVAQGTQRIWTILLNSQASASATTPLVLLHGMGAGVGLWALNLDAFARDRPVYAIDLLGFGQSSRVQFSSDAAEAEKQFVDSIEDWRQSVGIDKMILLGHSLGGFLAAAYTLRHADHVQHLVLVDPWGFPELPPDVLERIRNVPMWVKIIRPIFSTFNPFSALRVAGPWGPSVVARFRGDLVEKYSCLFNDNRIADYLYHLNAQKPSGEIAFKNMAQHYGWAKLPMLPRISDIPASVSMTAIYGSRSWVDYNVGYEIKYKRQNSFVDIQVVRDAGHHIYADKPELFNKIVCQTCKLVDESLHAGKGTSILRPFVISQESRPRTSELVDDGVVTEVNSQPQQQP
jgi:pimeloyl-ACP methyl ester carboxylesterase